MEISAITPSAIHSPTSPSQFTRLVEQWLSCHDVAEASRTAYRRNVRDFQRWCVETAVQAPDRATLLAYKKHLITRKFTACTQSNYLTSLRQFFRYLERATGYPDPTREIKGVLHPSGHRKDALSLDQIRALLASISTDSLMGLRDSAILNLAARTGVRGCEIARADVGDLQQRGEKYVLLVQGKGRLEKDNWVVIGEDCYAHLRNYLARRGATKTSDPLFASTSDGCRGDRLGTTTLRKIAKHYLRKIGLNTPRITLHSLRHTAITLALDGGATLLECKEMARHEAITTTMVYAHSTHRLRTAAELKLEDLIRSATPQA
jgi:integrase/recombinase XerC/integrase/recombinase XerD